MKEQEVKAKFRQFWMSSVADGFRDDLEEIRKVFSPHTQEWIEQLMGAIIGT